MTAQKKNLTEGSKIFEAVLSENYAREYFCATLKHASVKRFSDEELTLIFDRQPIASHFEKTYRKMFEESASKIIGRKITVKLESEA